MAEEPLLHTVTPGDTLLLLEKRYHAAADAILQANPEVDFTRVAPGTVLRIPVKKPDPPAFSQPAAQADGGHGPAPGRLTLRRLWQRQAALTRMTMMSILYDLPGLEETAARLAGNAGEIREALAPLYGAAKAAAFGRLLGEHAQLAGKLARAAGAGDFRSARETETSWRRNAEEMAGLLEEASGGREKFAGLLRDYLEATRSEITALTNRQYDKSLRLYERAEELALAIADLLAAAAGP